MKSVFMAALELPETERHAFLAESCGADRALLQEVTSLLASEAAAGTFCETPAVRLLGLEAASPTPPAPRLEPGTRLGSYQVLEFLSAGGMGEVYRARHVVLEREVALKTVQAPAGDDSARRRLVREARHASQLKHPGICAIHEVGEADGRPFIVMELLEGRPLSDVVRGGPLPLDRVIDCGGQIAAALEHAHRHGIIHRDLKSSNVMLDEGGRATVLDFGLSRRVLPGPSAPHSAVTAAGTFAGTLSHLPPEVLLGTPPDVRSDVWALGVLLYELATGHLPFEGRTSFETSSAILGAEPRWNGSRVPLALRLVIARCLTKDPARRFQSASAVRSALARVRHRSALVLAGELLRRLRTRTAAAAAVLLLLVLGGGFATPRWLTLVSAGATPAITTLAFLPLEDATRDPAAAYYAAGLTDGLGAELGSALNARVVAPTSAGHLARSGATPAAIGRDLGAQAVITGRLRRASDRIAVDLRLIDATSGRVLWSDTFERLPHQVLALQADIVRQLAAGVHLALRGDAGARLSTVRAVNPEAYEAYLKGRFEWNHRSEASLARALENFTRATELDATYAPAHAAVADVYNQYATVMVGVGSPREYRPQAAAAAIRALRIDPSSAEAHATLGYVQHYDFEWEEAERSFARAIELNPNYPLAHLWLANLRMSQARFDEALEHARTARELDPFSLIVNTNIGWIHLAAGRYDEAIRQLEWTLRLDSTYLQARARLSAALRLAGRGAESHAHVLQLVQLSGRSAHSLGMLAASHAHQGRTAEARAVLNELLELGRTRYISPAAVAETYDLLGDVDRALEWLERAYAERSNFLAYFVAAPGRPGMAGHPRALALHEAAGLPASR